MRKQVITVTLNLKDGQSSYGPNEANGYPALKHFFEDIDYEVERAEFKYIEDESEDEA